MIENIFLENIPKDRNTRRQKDKNAKPPIESVDSNREKSKKVRDRKKETI